MCKPAVDGAIGPYIAAIAEANGALGPDDTKSNMATSCDRQSQVNGVMDRPSTKSGSQVDVPEGFSKPLSGPVINKSIDAKCFNSNTSLANSSNMNISCFNLVFFG